MSPSFLAAQSQSQKCYQKDQELLGRNRCGREFGTTPAEDEEMEMIASQGQQFMPKVEARTLG